jgi:thiol-disulfide isomerase/thioredoxin
LDFWATWCGPCVAALPSLRELNKKYSKHESFVMLGISADRDEDKWSSFIGKEKMVWRHFLDREMAVRRAFRVNAFPTYILLDHESIIRFRTTGASFDKEAALSDAINKQIKLLQKAAPSN